MIQDRAEYAAKLLNDHTHNCAQAVCAALADETEFTEEQLWLSTAGFGGGMGSGLATCGALVGAAVITGIKTRDKHASRYTSQILKQFQSSCGAVTCRDIKTGSPEGKALCSCENCVRNAVLAYGTVMGLE